MRKTSNDRCVRVYLFVVAIMTPIVAGAVFPPLATRFAAAEELNEFGRSLQNGINASKNDRPEEAIYWFTRARDHLRSLPPSPAVAFAIETTNLRIARAMIDANRCAEAKALAEAVGRELLEIERQNVSIAVDMDFMIARIDALSYASRALHCLGDRSGAIARLEEAERLALSFGWPTRSKEFVYLRLALISLRAATDGDGEMTRRSLEAFIAADGTVLADDQEQRIQILRMLRDFCATAENKACVDRAKRLLANEMWRNATRPESNEQ